MKMWWGNGNIAPPYLNSELEGSQWSPSRPAALTLEKELPIPLDRKLLEAESTPGP
jgi:hypothetical protein